MKSALLLVDIQNDFIPGGALAVPGGDQVIPVANRIMSGFDLVVATQDWHPANHGSFASQYSGRTVGEIIELNGVQQILWPDHCIQESPGAEFATGLHVAGITKIVQKGMDPGVDSYSGFFDNDQRTATGLAEYLKEQRVTELVIMGLATDYCVKFTALDACRLGFEVKLLKEGVRGVEISKGDCEEAIEEMRQAGVTFITQEEIL